MYIVLHHFHIIQSHRYAAKSPIQITAPTSTDYSLANHITNSRCVVLNHRLIMSISISMVSLIYLR